MQNTFFDWPIRMPHFLWIIYANVHESLNNWFQQCNLQQHLEGATTAVTAHLTKKTLRRTKEDDDDLKHRSDWKLNLFFFCRLKDNIFFISSHKSANESKESTHWYITPLTSRHQEEEQPHTINYWAIIHSSTISPLFTAPLQRLLMTAVSCGMTHSVL